MHWFCTACIIFHSFPIISNTEEAAIEIDTKKNLLKWNGKVLKDFYRNSLFSILGRPDRIRKRQYGSYIKEFPLDSNDRPSYYPIQITDYYYIYDRFGVMFHTGNSEFPNPEPERMKIFFKNKREFFHKKEEPYHPKHSFSGKAIINGRLLEQDSKIISDRLDYRVNQFEMHDVLFGPTSFASVIDGLYCISASPYFEIELDRPGSQKISRLIIYKTLN